jgi:type IV secretion system protein VirB4
VVQDREIKEAIQHCTTQGAMGRLLDADLDSLFTLAVHGFRDRRPDEPWEQNLVPVLTYLFHRNREGLETAIRPS